MLVLTASMAPPCLGEDVRVHFFGVFGGPETLSEPNTSSGLAGSEDRCGGFQQDTFGGFFLTTRRVPASQHRRCLMDSGRINCPLVESVTVRSIECVPGK